VLIGEQMITARKKPYPLPDHARSNVSATNFGFRTPAQAHRDPGNATEILPAEGCRHACRHLQPADRALELPRAGAASVLVGTLNNKIEREIEHEPS
jgi:hypothetical protein